MWVGWVTLNRIWTSKKTHALAVKLVEMLVRRDTSWFVAHAQEQGTICLEREEKEETEIKTEEGTSKIGSSEKRSKSPDTPLLIADSTGIMEIVRMILEMYPQAVEHVSQKGQNILHVSILHRQFKIYDLVINEKKEATKRLVLGIDNDGSTILHHAANAANTTYYHGGIKPTPALQLQEELTWFQVNQSLSILIWINLLVLIINYYEWFLNLGCIISTYLISAECGKPNSPSLYPSLYHAPEQRQLYCKRVVPHATSGST